MNELLGKATSWDHPLVRDFLILRRTVLLSRAWHDNALARIENAGDRPDFELRTLADQSYRRYSVLDVKDGAIVVRPENASDPVSIQATDLSVPTLVSLQENVDALRPHVRAWLSYCDGDLMAAEQALVGVPEDSPFRKLMVTRLEAAWPIVAGVRTKEDKDAFKLWRQIIASYRTGDWTNALALVKSFDANKDFKKTGWYKKNRSDVRSILAEIRLRNRIASTLAKVHGKVEVMSLKPCTVKINWEFDNKSEATDFDLPKNTVMERSALRKKTAADVSPLNPTTVEPLTLKIPISLLDAPLELGVAYAPSSKVEETPRFLVMSAAGVHAGLLSRLQTRKLMHLPLHGVEKKLVDYAEFGIAAIWHGPLDAYQAAFASKVSKRSLILDGSKRYRFLFRIDAAGKKAQFYIDGELVSEQKVVVKEGRVGVVQVAIPMPHAIEAIELKCGLDLNER